MTQQSTTPRRSFLQQIALTGGGLMLGFKWHSAQAEMPQLLNAADPMAVPALNSYLRISTDGTVHIFSPNPELGQNIMTSFAQIVAEELDADWTQVQVSQAPLDTSAFDRQLTGGSGAIPHSWLRLRKAGASARWLLVQAAAQQWQVAPESCTTHHGKVLHTASGRSAHYGSLVAVAATLTLPTEVPLKDRKDFKLIGKPLRNVRNRQIITGQPLFGLDVQRPNMLIAVVQRAPFGAKVTGTNAAAIKQLPGVEDVVQYDENVAILGTRTWQLLKAKKQLEVTYNIEKNPGTDQEHEALFDAGMQPDAKTSVQRKDGDVDAAFAGAHKVISRSYQCPFLPHNALEPMNFFADVQANKVHLVGPLQTPQAARQAVSKLLNIPQENVTVEITRLGGGFGRRLRFDYVMDAAQLSARLQKPVKVLWTREDDMTGGFYRPAVRYRFEAALNAQGAIIGYKLRGVGINAGVSTRADNFPSGAVDNLLIESVNNDSSITTCPWRAPVTNFLAYAEQAFLDEVAEAAGQDPVAFRLQLLERARRHPVGKLGYNIERMETVIREVTQKSGWGKKPGVHQGFSVYFSHASYVAQVCEIEQAPEGPQVKKIYAVSDCGEVINQSGALQQVMGGIVDGFGHAMYGKLTFTEGRPEENNFHNYRMIRMKEIPAVEAHFVDNGIAPTGLGEPALPPTGGAVANAWYRATGKRLYRQPFVDHM